MFFEFSAIEVGSKNVTKFDPKLHQKREASWHRFCIPFGPNLGRFWNSKSMKNRCREGSKTDHFFGRFWYRFLMLFGYVLVANLPPTWDPRRAGMGPGAAQEASKIEEKWSSQAKTLPRAIWMRFWMDFGRNLGGFSMDFRWIFHEFWKQFWIEKSVYMSPRCFILRGRAQRTSERSERRERSAGEASKATAKHKEIFKNTWKTHSKQRNISEQKRDTQ